MAQTDPAGKAAPSGGFKTGGWYSGYQYWDGSFASRAGDFHPGSGKGGEAPIAPKDVAFIQQERIRADQIQAPTQITLPTTSPQAEFITGLTGEAEKARTALQEALAIQKAEVDTRITDLRAKEKETLGEIKTLTTPFREDLETAERDRLFINQNFEANQVLINELDTLLTEGNDLIRQQKEVTGLSAIRNPRIQKSMDDVAARTGVIQAVINARNGQITVAENLIDRTVTAIAGDRQDQIDYYTTILELDRQDILNLDEESKSLAKEQLAIKKNDLARAEATVDYVKQLLIDPATAGLLGEGGVKLTDSVAEINTKLTQATFAREVRDMSNEMVLDGVQAVLGPKGIPADELRILTDSRGGKHYFRVKEKVGVGTASDRAVNSAVSAISSQGITFPEVVVSFANQLTLSQIYSAYGKSEMGQKFGRPIESSNEISLLYQWARGEITENEYRAKVGG